jgi:hypothetical protein
VYGGIQSQCYTPVSQYGKPTNNINKIVSINPQTANNSIVCTTSVIGGAYFDVCSLSGVGIIKHVEVLPRESVTINTHHLEQGYYLLVLRSNNGLVLDRKPFIVTNH